MNKILSVPPTVYLRRLERYSIFPLRFKDSSSPASSIFSDSSGNHRHQPQLLSGLEAVAAEAGAAANRGTRLRLRCVVRSAGSMIISACISKMTPNENAARNRVPLCEIEHREIYEFQATESLEFTFGTRRLIKILDITAKYESRYTFLQRTPTENLLTHSENLFCRDLPRRSRMLRQNSQEMRRRQSVSGQNLDKNNRNRQNAWRDERKRHFVWNS